MKKKVCHFIVGLQVGGAEMMLEKLIMNSSENIEHHVISLTSIGVIGKRLENNNISVYEVNINKFFGFIFFPFFIIYLLKRIKPSVVQTWMYHSDFIGGILAKICGIPMILWGIRNTQVETRGGLSKKIIRLICSKLSYTIPDKIICVANSARDSHRMIGYCDKKMVVIENGFDTKKFNTNKSRRKEIRDSLSIPSNAIVIGSVGRFMPAKDHNFLLAVMNNFNKDNIYTVVIGRDTSNIFLENHPKINKNNLIILNQRDDLHELYCIFDIFFLHSRTEGFPNVLGEAMSCGITCITTDVGDAKKIVADENLVVDESIRLNSAIQKMSRLISMSNDERAIIGQRLRKRVEDHYSIEAAVKNFERFYMESSK